MNRVAIFVDAANIFYAQRDNGWQIDFKRVYNYFKKGKQIYGAYYFTGTPSFEDVEKIRTYRSYRGFLIHVGYTVIDKEIKIMTDKTTGEKVSKGNLDVEITLHMLSSMDGYDEAVFLGGDGDFVPLVDHLRKSGKRVISVGRRQSTAMELINISNLFIDLNDIKEEIEKKKTK